MTNLYLDCEWFLNQKIFLFGWAYSLSDYGQLFDRTLTRKNVIKILKRVDGFIFFYGPDIAMIEKNYKIDIRHKYKCINLLRVFRKQNPRLKSYKLEAMEKRYKIKRTTPQYKANIFNALRDWYNPEKKFFVLVYNMEDVLNLIRVKKKFISDHPITNSKLLLYMLK